MKALIKRKRSLEDQLSKCTNMIRGSINSVCSRCHRAKCVCQSKTNRKIYRLTYKDKEQKTQIVYIPKDRLQEIKAMLVNYTKGRKIIDQLIINSIKLFKLRLRV